MPGRLSIALVALLAAVVLALAVAVARDDRGAATQARVTRVVDGDTLTITLAGRRERVRLIGIDAPEVSHDGSPSDCYGRAATRLLRRLADDRTVEVRPGREQRDRYGRLLAYVKVRGAADDLQTTLLRAGAARTLEISPNTANAARYAELAAAARAQRRGLWRACA